MPLDLDPIYHTETMVKILREQGSSQYALELAEKILQNNPAHTNVKTIWNELKEDMRKAFERFRQGGRVQPSEQMVEEDPLQPEEDSISDYSPPRLNLVPIENEKKRTVAEKIDLLQTILNRLTAKNTPHETIPN